MSARGFLVLLIHVFALVRWLKTALRRVVSVPCKRMKSETAIPRAFLASEHPGSNDFIIAGVLRGRAPGGQVVPLSPMGGETEPALRCKSKTFLPAV